MKFQGKARTLASLKDVVKSATVLKLQMIAWADWSKDRHGVLKSVERNFSDDPLLIVRSSSEHEDGAQSSAAGQFLSVGHVVRETLADSIDRVFSSYKEGRGPDAHLFIQPMIAQATVAGVAFTQDPNTGGPYYIINYDDSGSTDSVTSGMGRETKTFVSFKCRTEGRPEKFEGLYHLLEELEQIFPKVALDVEFAVDQTGRLFLLQVRPLSLAQTCDFSNEELSARLGEIFDKVQQWMAPKPFLLGTRTVFGVMPDWNPAEIVGIRPRPLALTLYKDLVTDSTWAYQRDNYGYRNLRSQPLIQSFQGCPYIDVRVDFNSFVPADIPEPLADKLVEYYLSQLRQKPHLHDKVEFEIIFSCYHFELSRQIHRLASVGFNAGEIDELTQSLRRLTTRIVNKDTGLWKKDLERISILEERHKVLTSGSMSVVEKIYWLLEDCKRYGTLPFAGLARAGFIAVQMLKSMVTAELLTAQQYGEFLNSLNTISTRMAKDYQTLSRETFLPVYGHLRPGTYDILSARYDEAPDAYFDWDKRGKESKGAPFKLDLTQYGRIQSELERHGLDLDVLGLFDFLKSAIEGREYAKFLFTRNVSDALSLIKHLGTELDISCDDLSYLDIHSLQRLYSSSQNTRHVLLHSIEQGKQAHAVTRAIVLPSLIFEPEDVYNFHLLETDPNYITQLSVESDVIVLNSQTQSIDGKIVLIENADPGFDWIFTRGISGFITMYGGANSHMAIRAGEMKIPAVVGVGEGKFQRWSKAKRLAVDCSNRQVRILQ